MANDIEKYSSNALDNLDQLDTTMRLGWSARRQPMIENARLIWRNFAGAEKQFNPAGKRNATLVLTEEIAVELEALGMNVKRRPPRDEGGEEMITLEVAVNYSESTRDPRLILITSRGRTQLDKDTVAALDFASLVKSDIVINPYSWSVNGNSGVKAYLEQGYFIIEENAFERRYAAIPDADGPRADTIETDPDEIVYDADGDEI